MISNFRVRIPQERVGVLIGPDGSVKKKLETLFQVRLVIDGESGEVKVIPVEGQEDPTANLKAQNAVQAIGRGFPPEKAFFLQKDEFMLDVIDLRDLVPKSRGNISRIKARIIGRDGKTRQVIEETTDAQVCVYGNTVSLIGGPSEVEIAKDAIFKLVGGSEHKTVYRYLSRMRHELKKERLKLWEG